MTKNSFTTNTLTWAWATLMALSIVLALAAEAQRSALALAAISLACALKARIVLRRYLQLERAPGALAGFSASVVVVLALVAASILIFPTPARQLARAQSELVSTTGANGSK